MHMLEYFAGIDWGSETHQVCVVDSAGEVSAERAFSHGGAGLAEMAAWTLARAGVEPQAVGVAIEIPHGPVVETMMERGFTVYSVNPKQLDRFRDRFSPAGAKDDRRDARVLADALRTDSDAFRRLDPAAPEIVELREWSRIANDLTCDRTRLVNRARQQLWRYYPQLLKVESDLTRAWVRELWCLAPTPARAQRVRAATVAKLLKRHRVRRIDAETALRILREQAVSVAPGTTEAAVAHIEVVFSQLAVIAQQLAKAYGELDRLSATLSRSAASPEDEPGINAQRDVEILSSLPRRRQDRPRHAAGRSTRSSAPARLSGPAMPVRRRSRDQTVRQVADRHTPSRVSQPAPGRRLPLGRSRDTARPRQQGEIRRLACPRSRPRSRASRRRRPPARRRLRDARKPDRLQSSLRETSPCSVTQEPHRVPSTRPRACRISLYKWWGVPLVTPDGAERRSGVQPVEAPAGGAGSAGPRIKSHKR